MVTLATNKPCEIGIAVTKFDQKGDISMNTDLLINIIAFTVLTFVPELEYPDPIICSVISAASSAGSLDLAEPLAHLAAPALGRGCSLDDRVHLLPAFSVWMTLSKEIPMRDRIINICAFAILTLLWLAFAVALIFNRAMLDATWQAFRNWPFIVQLVAGLLALPVVLGLWIWETSWPLLLRLVIVIGLAWVTIYTFFPRKTPNQKETRVALGQRG
jgi:hypothetical protein